MPNRLRAVAFDLDRASMASLREAFPDWEIEVVNGAIAALTDDWNLRAADLLVVNARDDVAETLGLCRSLVICGAFATSARHVTAENVGLSSRGQKVERRAHAPLLVLVSPGEESLVRVLLEAGADSCLELPVHAKELTTMLARVHAGNQPGRHTLNLNPAQSGDLWRDDGGQG